MASVSNTSTSSWPALLKAARIATALIQWLPALPDLHFGFGAWAASTFPRNSRKSKPSRLQ